MALKNQPLSENNCGIHGSPSDVSKPLWSGLIKPRKSFMVWSPGHSCCRKSASRNQQKILNRKWIHGLKNPTSWKKLAPHHLTNWNHKAKLRKGLLIGQTLDLLICGTGKAVHASASATWIFGLPPRVSEVWWNLHHPTEKNTNVAVHHGFTSHKKANKYHSSGCTPNELH